MGGCSCSCSHMVVVQMVGVAASSHGFRTHTSGDSLMLAVRGDLSWLGHHAYAHGLCTWPGSLSAWGPRVGVQSEEAGKPSWLKPSAWKLAVSPLPQADGHVGQRPTLKGGGRERSSYLSMEGMWRNFKVVFFKPQEVPTLPSFCPHGVYSLEDRLQSKITQMKSKSEYGKGREGGILWESTEWGLDSFARATRTQCNTLGA